MHTIGVDIGGTKISAGVVDEAGQVIESVKRDTNAGDSQAIDQTVIDLVTELRSQHEVSAVGIAAAGFVSSDRRTILFAPNIAFRNHNLADPIEDAVGLPVVVENDANAAGWGEFRFGVAQDVEHMVMLTIGTGLGGAIVSDGHLVRGAWGMAGELGHMRVVPGGHACGCGREGCWEQYASGTALNRWARQAVQKDPDTAAGLIEASGGNPENLTGPQITFAAQNGDWLATSLLATLGGWLGEGMASVASALDPQMFVIGGGVASAGELILKPAREAFSRELPAKGHHPMASIVLASLGNDAGIVGAADLARV